MTVPIRTESGLLADWQKPSPETCVYRIYDVNDVLLYVGITNNLTIRWSEHKSNPWWRTVGNRYDVRWYSTRATAAMEEKHAIMTEHPKYNSLCRSSGTTKPRYPGVYSVKEIAEFFHFSIKTVRKMITQDDFPQQLTGLPASAGRGARYSASEVEAFLTRRRETGSSLSKESQ